VTGTWFVVVAAAKAVLVTGAAPGPDPSRIEAARAELASRFELVEGPRDVLEGYATPAPAGEQVRDALERAHQHLRRFDLPSVRQTLAEARQASLQLAPTPESRRLAALVALREAELAMVARDRAAERRAAAFALSIDPSLAPDPRREPPLLVASIERTRQALSKLARVSVRVETLPPAGEVHLGEHTVGPAPVELQVPPGPLVVWATRDGFAPRALWSDAAVGTVTIELEPLEDAARVRPLVQALRQADAAHRRAAALALVDALGVDAVALLESDGRVPVVYQRRLPEPSPPPPPTPAFQLAAREPPMAASSRAPVYRRAWFWAVVGGAVVASLGAFAMYYYSQPETVSYTCCR
jgi:hypothetical protein